jgi:hypothetical protein
MRTTSAFGGQAELWLGAFERCCGQQWLLLLLPAGR